LNMADAPNVLTKAGRSGIASDMLRFVLEKQELAHSGAWVQTQDDWVIRDVRIGSDVTVITVTGAGVDYLLKLSVAGRHFAQSAVDMLAQVEARGADPLTASMDIAAWRPKAGQGRRKVVITDMANDGESLALIDSSEVANAEVLAASLEVLARSKPTDGVGRIVKGRRIAFLGDLSGPLPDIVQDPHMKALDQVHCVGQMMQSVWTALPEIQQGRCAGAADELASHITRLVDAGDIVLVLGTKGANLGVIVDAIKKLGHRRSQEQ
jgi:UDP-N-acetylmuramoyl-tripeptide--D-alanyl-D-alanine ligase